MESELSNETFKNYVNIINSGKNWKEKQSGEINIRGENKTVEEEEDNKKNYFHFLRHYQPKMQVLHIFY